MSKRIFTREEITVLETNENVSKVSEKSISYKSDFKIQAVKQNIEGLGPKEIFIKAGFNINIIGLNVPHQCLSRWKSIYSKLGNEGFESETRGRSTGSNRGRPTNEVVTIEEENRRLKAKIAYLEAENDLIKKLNKLEASVMKK